MRLFLPGCCLALLLGCFTPPVVIPCPPPPPVTQPTLRTAVLTSQTPADKVLEAYVLDLADWVGYGKRLEKLLDAYRPAPTPPAQPR